MNLLLIPVRPNVTDYDRLYHRDAAHLHPFYLNTIVANLECMHTTV